nr:phosphatase PAP2 family protein [Neoroseomonas oryzicola]
MHGGTPLWRHLHPVLTPYTRYIDIFYNVFWQVAMLTMVLAMAFANQRRRRFFIIFFLCWIVLGNVLAGMFYSAGPIFYDRVVGDAQRFRFLLDYIGGYQDPPLAVSVYQSYLWTLHRLGAPEFGSGISAFPSMHVSMATLIALWLTRMHRRLAIPAVLMVLLTQAGSVHLGWHYAVDGYASIVLTYLIWRTVDQAASRQPVRRTAPPAALDGAMAPAGAGG